jgi:carbon storage regulator
MLVLSRKLNEKVMIQNGQIVLQILGIDKYSVKLGITAPVDIPVHREEVQKAIDSNAPRRRHSKV